MALTTFIRTRTAFLFAAITFCCGVSVATPVALSQTIESAQPLVSRPNGIVKAVHQANNQSNATLVGFQEESNTVFRRISDGAGDSTSYNSTPIVAEPALIVQEQTDQDDVPNPPQTGEQFQQIGPALSVQSNAATMPDECYQDQGCNLGCPIKIFPTSYTGTQIGGWFQYGYHNRNTPAFNRHASDDSVHQLWMFAERKACRDCNWNFGYRVDALYGLDAQRTQAFGNEPAGNPSGWDNSWDNGRYGFALPQAYVEVTRGDLAIKAGKFFSIFGYEAIPSVENFFYSRSNSMYFIEPFTHTGVLGEYQYDCNTTCYAGATLGWDTGFDQFGDAVNYIGGFKRRLNESVDLTYMASRFDTGLRGSGHMQSVVLDVMLTDKINTVIQNDWSDLWTNQDLSLVHYLFYRQNDCLAWGTRFEWLRSDRFTGNTNSSWSATVGANIRPHANIVIRPEFRIDGGQAAISPGDPIVGIDAIVTF